MYIEDENWLLNLYFVEKEFIWYGEWASDIVSEFNQNITDTIYEMSKLIITPDKLTVEIQIILREIISTEMYKKWHHYREALFADPYTYASDELSRKLHNGGFKLHPV